MNFSIRIKEYKIFFYRLLLVYLFYFVARLFFYAFNQELLDVTTFSEFLNICYRGLSFDTTAILYINSLFLLMSLLPLFVNTSKAYQKVVIWVYFVTNLIAYATNFIDFIYYKFTFTRTTTAGLESVENEDNKMGLLFTFLIDYWYVFLLFFITSYVWIKLYKRVEIEKQTYPNKITYVLSSIVIFCGIAVLTVGGIRGDFKHSTRPITLVDANRHVSKVAHSDMILNTPFAIIRTINKNYFKKRKGVDQKVIVDTFNPIKKYNRSVTKKPNVVVLIVESFAREYIGSFNEKSGIDGYEGYTPFVDSLAQHSLIFPNAYANGRKSIHAMSSILAGIPSFKVAYTSSPYSNQKTQSMVSAFNDMGYDTSFFHGAPNGSMGFLGYSNILGFDHYYGKTEYNNDDDFDGLWGIWDKPFLNYTSDVLSKKQEPFMATLITLSSHSPYKVPEAYKGKFPKGNVPIHKCVGYTDEALKEFFKKASKEDWYENTIFVITADHCNQIYYDEYVKMVNRFAVPILIFKPKNKIVGKDYSLAQQIDIYPTIMDMVGYNKPFMSWGRSLVGDDLQEPYAITHNGSTFQFMNKGLICSMDDKNILGYYDIEDKGLKNNLKENTTKEMEVLGQKAKGFVQDYMNRIIDNKLSATPIRQLNN